MTGNTPADWLHLADSSAALLPRPEDPLPFAYDSDSVEEMWVSAFVYVSEIVT